MEILTEKYIQVNSIIKEIEQMLIKTHILDWNSIDFENYTDNVYKNTNVFDFHNVLNKQYEPLSVCIRTMKYLSDSRDPEIFDNIWFVDKEYKFQLSPIASKEHLSELFDEYILVLTATKNILIESYYDLIYFSPYVYDNISACISTLESYIKHMKFIVKDLYMNHRDYSYKYEAKYYLDKINDLVKQNKRMKCVVHTIKEHLDKINKCLSGEEIIKRVQTCYDKIYNYYNGDESILNKIEELVIEYNQYKKTREISDYINAAYKAIEKEREYMAKPWGKTNMLITKLFYELDFSTDENAIETYHWNLIEQYLRILYEVLHSKYNDPVTILPTVEKCQKMILSIIGNYSFQYYTEDPHGIDYESYPYLMKKYISPIISFVKQQADQERFH